jgi:hypothetical protein
MLAGYEVNPVAAAFRFAPLFCFALLCACAAPSEAPPPPQSGAPATVAPTSGKLAGGINLSVLQLEPHNTSPGLCEAAVYGSIAAARGIGLCVCQPEDDRERGDWVQVITKQPCWSGAQ